MYYKSIKLKAKHELLQNSATISQKLNMFNMEFDARLSVVIFLEQMCLVIYIYIYKKIVF